MSIELIGEHVVSEYFACYESYGDTEGLSDREIASWDEFVYELLAGYDDIYRAPLTIDWNGERDESGCCEVTGLRGAVVTIKVYAERIKA